MALENQMPPRFFSLGIFALCVSIAITVTFNQTIDNDYFTRRIHIYSLSYLSIFYFLESLLFTIWLRNERIKAVSLWRYLGYGLIIGLMAGPVAYFFGITIDIFGATDPTKRRPLLEGTIPEMLFVHLTYPTIILRKLALRDVDWHASFRDSQDLKTLLQMSPSPPREPGNLSPRATQLREQPASAGLVQLT